ncbi:MAG: acetate--CoA ligase family protein [Proteobacteria bacterium]|nr:acetate--CoA ligase family protein [Pseudomonadota bacterium]MBU1452682.1 acetate--CoA ligase family protein [Pseudomonadota bacterium]MBU2467205.1 acetate--CoA ligase family protein [Pseudomonadota bacterium]MBU2518969.1 acetate--CoA ligase family protein [Pseudomonadota bacterium]
MTRLQHESIGEIKALLAAVRQKGRTRLSESEAKQVLAKAGLEAPREILAQSREAAIAAAAEFGMPVVLKVASADILHKSDSGCVKVGLADGQAVGLAFEQIMDAAAASHPQAVVDGVLVQEMVSGGVETIVGVANRPPFGPVVAFGLGGVFVEVLGDITFRLAPIDQSEALGMTREIKGSAMLDGYRGQPAADREALAGVIALLSELAVACHDQIEELDINPLVVKGGQLVALDALITLRAEQEAVAGQQVRSAPVNDMTAVLEPRSIAVIGASTDPTKTGHVLFKNIIVNGFDGEVYPINPNADEILGRKAYPNILAVPGDIDLVFFLLPGKFVPTLFKDCEQKGVKAACIISAGFAEAGEEGAKQQAILSELIKESGTRCLGPNSIGFINMDQNLVASFILFENWEDGSIALGGQSGIFAGAVADEVMKRTVQRIGIGKSVIFGNKIDLDETDFVQWAMNDDNTKIVAMHLEGMQDPRAFLSVANQAKRDMPIIVLKPGRTSAGAKASASHTGSLALDDTLVDHALRQYGLIRAYDLEEFVEYMKVFQYQPLPQGNRVGIVTFSGANGVMSSDELFERGFEVVAQFAPETNQRLEKFLPEWQPPANPLDLWAAMGAGNRLAHEEGLLAVINDPGVDAVLVILLALANAEFDGIEEVFASAMEQQPEKPIYVVSLGGAVKQRWLREMDGLKVPVFDNTLIAVKSLEAARRYALTRDDMQPDPVIE